VARGVIRRHSRARRTNADETRAEDDRNDAFGVVFTVERAIERRGVTSV
jgi:hypothetical protein